MGPVLKRPGAAVCRNAILEQMGRIWRNDFAVKTIPTGVIAEAVFTGEVSVAEVVEAFETGLRRRVAQESKGWWLP